MTGRDRRRFNMRAHLMLAVLLGGLGLCMLRAVQLQIYDHRNLARFARDEYLNDLKVPARRGHIYDRNGQPLAISVDVPSVYANPALVREPRNAARRLSAALETDLDQTYARLASDRLFVWLKRQVTPDVAAKIEALHIDGIAITKESRRFYPNRELAAHVVGFAGMDGGGLEGIEREFNTILAGEPQVVPVIKDARGNAVLAGDLDPGRRSSGADLHLTIDVRIQHAAQVALDKGVRGAHAKAGVVVVLDVPTAEVLAMAAQPVFNPNQATTAEPETRRNRAVTDMFEPGSSLKPLVVATALNAHAVSPSASIFCENGSLTLGEDVIRDTKPHGWLGLTDIIAKSSNIGAAKVGLALGRERLFSGLKAFGFGERSGLAFPGETPGALRPPETWSQVGIATVSFGHGIAVNALQLAVAYRALAASGRYIAPEIVRTVERADGQTEPPPARHERQVLTAKTTRLVTAMMEKVISAEGTGSLARVPGYRVAGKTGTAQKADPLTGGYSADRYMAVFVGFLPAETPRVVIAVAVDEPEDVHTGGTVAAPVFAEIADATMRYLGVAPSEIATGVPPPSEIAVQDGEATMVFSAIGKEGGFGFDSNEVYAVVGTLGTATGNATYVSLGVNNARLRLGAANVDGTKVVGSTDPAWYPGVDNLDKFYVYYFTRHCEGLEELTHGFCLSVKDTELVIPPGDKASFVERDYIALGTQRGPDSKFTLPSMVLKFQRPTK